MAIALRAASTPASGTPGATVTGTEPTGTVQNAVVWALWRPPAPLVAGSRADAPSRTGASPSRAQARQ